MTTAARLAAPYRIRLTAAVEATAFFGRAGKPGRCEKELPACFYTGQVSLIYEISSPRPEVKSVSHEINGRLIQLHRRWGDARLLRWLGRFSVGQAREALDEILHSEPNAESLKFERLASELSNRGTFVLSILDLDYPVNLRVLEADAPPLLYVSGDPDRLKARSVAIIGTRRPSAAGRIAARLVAAGATGCNWTIVSGNAPGVDSHAHCAAVESGGQTMVFPPVPLEQYKPSFRGATADQVTVASPFAPGSSVAPWMFLRRNSLVAAHCSAGFVAETGAKGGTLDTVKKLRKLRREIFATALPDEARYANAHKLLAAGGVTMLDVADQSDSWLTTLTAAAEDCWRHPLPCTPVLEDFFPEEISL